ncbi:hypothetical protein DKX38_028046 [Salix brachista]|uniref:Ultraviolet-B receptor UVR8 n=1 Tax=Salix brachista TaxID=2182728 RepID=A0A5N5J881_9ROSI|nr:hypothetical protein DKX38_028046 [Salix brachista]
MTTILLADKDMGKHFIYSFFACNCEVGGEIKVVNLVLAPPRTPLCLRKSKLFRFNICLLYMNKQPPFPGVSIKLVAAATEHTTDVIEDGELYGWGWGRYGNFGLGDRNDRLVPEKVSLVNGDKMIMVACGWRHTISVSSSGGLYTYGWSKYGQLGHGDFEDHLTPHKVEALRGSSISLISGGWRHTMALTSDGNLYGWGWNKQDILDSLDRFELVTKLIIALLCKLNFHMIGHILVTVKVVQISCRWRHALAVTERQNVFSWGRGTNGQLGHGESMDRSEMSNHILLSSNTIASNIQYEIYNMKATANIHSI